MIVLSRSKGYDPIVAAAPATEPPTKDITGLSWMWDPPGGRGRVGGGMRGEGVVWGCACVEGQNAPEEVAETVPAVSLNFCHTANWMAQ